MKKFFEILVADILVVVVAMVFMLPVPAVSTAEGYVPSPSMESIYGVKSDFFSSSKVAHHLSIYDVMLVDFDDEEANVYESGEVDGYFYFPELPDRLVLVLLSDGGNYIAPASFNVVSRYCVHARFFLEDLRDFSTFNGLYLILVEYLL